tara:strand:+ start:7350 stop:8741 length:1392 start_codon:yes stop_codon:yes gene_type:complete
LAECLNRLQHRGPDDRETWIEGDLALGFSRLAINGVGPTGRQPHRYSDLVGVINGEIYNNRALVQEYDLTASASDTNVVLPLFDLHGPRMIDQLDGFYSGVLFRLGNREAICLRDHIGKKPLFIGRSQGELFIVSELKTLEDIDWFEPLPLGTSMVDLETGQVTQLAKHLPLQVQQGLVHIFENAVRKRMPRSDQPVGVFLSGGLDSSLIASFVSRLRDDATYFTLGDADSPDRQAVETVVTALRLKDVRILPLPSPELIPELVKSVVYATESFNPSIVSNGLATYLLAKAAHEAGIKVVLTGEGADELFGGYHLFCEEDPWREVRSRLIEDMQFTELRRLDMSCMAHSVEARCPFLDPGVHGFSDSLEFHEMYDSEENKVSLRRCFEGVLPPSVLHRRKTSFDVGSGIRGQIVQYLRRNGRSEREELRDMWREFFPHDASAPYFHAYPVFDTVIDRRGATHR